MHDVQLESVDRSDLTRTSRLGLDFILNATNVSWLGRPVSLSTNKQKNIPGRWGERGAGRFDHRAAVFFFNRIWARQSTIAGTSHELLSCCSCALPSPSVDECQILSLFVSMKNQCHSFYHHARQLFVYTQGKMYLGVCATPQFPTVSSFSFSLAWFSPLCSFLACFFALSSLFFSREYDRLELSPDAVQPASPRTCHIRSGV